MILIFGGAYQGKTAYAREHFGDKTIVNNFERIVLDWIKAGECLENNLQHFIEKNSSSVIVCTDISCGVVPIDPTMRKWRECVGRAMVLLTQKSNKVIRIYCGIPTTLK
ncbi:MAG: bifunctional adenosylcobinamide kinase/adenosylcobinamide-phosphate guanylyltransferase [Defluviitaleaceae bacterium]|nr:bifunctional adenosylcobinamide kinase/adenosylcobinamide-phosphate guanylyltransferase [Defluviitaleaceae bacterium]